MITKLPHNEIGKFIKYKIRYAGTSDDYIIYDDSENMRLGVYYYESGAYPRLPVASYDRRNSSFTTFKKEELHAGIYTNANVFYTSGIILALSDEVAENHPNLEIIASTNRKVISAQKHTFSSLVYDAKTGEYYEESTYEKST